VKNGAGTGEFTLFIRPFRGSSCDCKSCAFSINTLGMRRIFQGKWEMGNGKWQMGQTGGKETRP